MVLIILNVYYQSFFESGSAHDATFAENRFEYPEELLYPLAERSSKIERALAKLLRLGHDPNETAGYENALMIAVRNADVHMAEYLIESGADVHSWPEQKPSKGKKLYLEMVDMEYTEAGIRGGSPVYRSALLNTARTLVKGEPFEGISLRTGKDGSIMEK